MNNLGKKLAEIRKEMGKSQRQLAQLLDIPRATWSNYEVGKTNPPLKILIKLAKMGYTIPELTTGMVSDMNLLDNNTAPQNRSHKDFSLFKFSHAHIFPVLADKTDSNSVVLLPVFRQAVSIESGQRDNQLLKVDTYLPIMYEMLGGANPINCGIVRIEGDSMIDINLFNEDIAIFDRTQREGNGIFVISIADVVSIKRLEYRHFEKKVIISSENMQRYPSPEVINYEEAKSLLHIHGKIICWMHKHLY